MVKFGLTAHLFKIMFSRILLPTDGSPASVEAAMAGVEFARRMSAELVGVFVVPELNYPIYIESMPPTSLTSKEYRASMQTVGETFLNEMRETAAKSGVKFSGKVMFFDAVPSGIIKMAEENGCDMIFMSSHGQSGGGQILLGSVTSKVLALSRIPVLVYRPLVTERKPVES